MLQNKALSGDSTVTYQASLHTPLALFHIRAQLHSISLAGILQVCVRQIVLGALQHHKITELQWKHVYASAANL